MPKRKKPAPKPVDRVIWCDRGWLPTFFGFCPSEAAWKREMRRLKVTDTDADYPTTHGRTTAFHGEKGLAIIVTIAGHCDRNDRIGIMALLAHEATHVWQKIKEDIGEDAPGREIEAYAIQNITLSLCSAYSRTRRQL